VGMTLLVWIPAFAGMTLLVWIPTGFPLEFTPAKAGVGMTIATGSNQESSILG